MSWREWAMRKLDYMPRVNLRIGTARCADHLCRSPSVSSGQAEACLPTGGVRPQETIYEKGR